MPCALRFLSLFLRLPPSLPLFRSHAMPSHEPARCRQCAFTVCVCVCVRRPKMVHMRPAIRFCMCWGCLSNLLLSLVCFYSIRHIVMPNIRLYMNGIVVRMRPVKKCYQVGTREKEIYTAQIIAVRSFGWTVQLRRKKNTSKQYHHANHFFYSNQIRRWICNLSAWIHVCLRSTKNCFYFSFLKIRNLLEYYDFKGKSR